MQTDGSGPALFSLFVQRLKENLHLVLAMSPTSDKFKKDIAKYPALLNCCHINWVARWPDDALNFVSKKQLRDAKMSEGSDLDGCVALCEYFHNSTMSLSKEMHKKRGLFNYVTPASYLELNNLFKSLLEEQSIALNNKKTMYETSLQKLQEAEDQVNVMQNEMTAIQPNLTEASAEVDSYMAMCDKEQVEVAELEKVVKADDSSASEKKRATESISNDCENELTEANVVLESALDALTNLLPAEIQAARGVKSPPACLKLNLEALCIFKGIKPDRMPDSSGPNKMVDDYWGPSKRLLADPKLVENLTAFDKDNIPQKTAKVIREKYLSNSDMNPDKFKSSLPAIDNVAHALYGWIVSVDMYERVARSIAPKRESLAKAEGEHQEAVEKCNEGKMQLKAAQEKLKAISLSLQQKKERKAELENDVDLCSRKLERAEQLISQFGGEREKWNESKDDFERKLRQLTGDMLLCAGTVAYLGVFPFEERCVCVM